MNWFNFQNICYPKNFECFIKYFESVLIITQEYYPLFGYIVLNHCWVNWSHPKASFQTCIDHKFCLNNLYGPSAQFLPIPIYLL